MREPTVMRIKDGRQIVRVPRITNQISKVEMAIRVDREYEAVRDGQNNWQCRVADQVLAPAPAVSANALRHDKPSRALIEDLCAYPLYKALPRGPIRRMRLVEHVGENDVRIGTIPLREHGPRVKY